MTSAATSRPKVLFILTSRDKLGDSDKPTGWFLPELSHPYDVLAPHYDVSIASPAGGEAPIDPYSLEYSASDEISQKFMRNQEHLWKNTVKIDDYIGKAADFDLVYVVGGHGPMWDLTHNPSSQKLLAEFFEAGKYVAAVCHGPGALLHVTLSNGELLIKDQPVTAFSNLEEQMIEFDKLVPYALETELVKGGGKYEKADAPWGAHVSVGRGGRLITGQNPASAAGVAEAFLNHHRGEK